MTHSRCTSRTRCRRGFTLVELLVVVAVIMLVAGATLPSIIRLYTSGADSMAYNLVSAQLGAARALAIREGRYVGLHFQLAAPEAKLGNAQLIGVVVQNDAGLFQLADGFTPQRLAGNFAFGQVDANHYNTSAKAWTNAVRDNEANFTTFTIVFTPEGKLTRTIDNGPGSHVAFDGNDPAFYSGADAGLKKLRLWDVVIANNAADGERPVTAIVMFDLVDYREFGRDPAWLARSAQVIPVNVYTGQLFSRRSQ